MLQDLDETLEQLLTTEIPRISTGEVNISFAAPDRESTTTVIKPTINLFLYDIRENLELRSNDWLVQRQSDGTALKYQPPARVDCSYLITVSSKSNDEHRWLGEVMKVLLRYPKIPAEFLQGSLKEKELPLPTSALRPPQSQNLSEFWQAMGAKAKAILNYTVTITVDVNEPIEAGKLVQKSVIEYPIGTTKE